ncbi:hypothetical protein D9M73_176990 [compost metagenome]
MRATSSANSSIHRKNIHRLTNRPRANQKRIAIRPPSRVEPSSSRPAVRALVAVLCWPRLTDFMMIGM